jgi:hypothetical protein
MLAGCGSFPQSPDNRILLKSVTNFDSVIFNKGNRGIVLVQMNNDLELGNYFDIAKKDSDFNFEVGLRNNEVRILMLPEGVYTIHKFNLYSQKTVGNTTITRSLDVSKILQKIDFSVKNGEVIYLGNITVNTASVEDRSPPKRETFFSSYINNKSKKLKIGVKITDNLKDIKKLVKHVENDVEKEFEVRLLKIN